MLIVYRKDDKTVVEISGVRVRPDTESVPESMIYGFYPVEPLADDLDMQYVTDVSTMRSVWELWDVARNPKERFECVAVFNDEGKIVGIERKTTTRDDE